jgi:hypothetical protein
MPDINQRLELAIKRMEVRRSVFSPEHLNHDAKELTDGRHFSARHGRPLEVAPNFGCERALGTLSILFDGMILCCAATAMSALSRLDRALRSYIPPIKVGGMLKPPASIFVILQMKS